MKNVNIIPAALLSEVYSPWSREPGFMVNHIKKTVDEGFYKALETGTHFNQTERIQVADTINRNGVTLTQWLTPMLDHEQLSLSSLDEEIRNHSVKRVLQQLPLSAECGATTIAFISGDDPGSTHRAAALDVFADSVQIICEHAAGLGLNVIIEPLDTFAHKKKLLGMTPDTVSFLSTIRQEHPNLGFAFDSAHTALNEEDILASLTLAAPLISQIHLSNAVLNKEDPLYGDNHIAPGAPGFLTVDYASEIIKTAQRLGICREKGLKVSVEARGLKDDDRELMYQRVTLFLRNVLSQMN